MSDPTSQPSDWRQSTETVARSLALSLRQGGTLLGALATTTIANAIQRPQTHQRRGAVRVSGIDDEVEIIRDQYGVPHCYAQSADDALFALGYVQAQDRLWQMHWNRCAAQGRLSELAGPQALSADRFTRTLGIGHAAAEAWRQTSDRQQQQLAPYIAGINAAIARAPRPFEARMLGAQIGEWHAAHSIGWGKLLSILLAPAWEQQLMRARVVEQHGLETLSALDPPAEAGTTAAVPPDAPYAELAGPILQVAQRMSDLLGLRQGASNNWAVDGRHTADGTPLFACDPHLNPVTPPHTYFVHLHCPEFDAAGASVPGLPGIVWGHNDHIAWGPTAGMMSMNLAVVEQLSDDHSQSLTPDGWASLTERNETIQVRGYRAEQLTVRETVHGPIVSEILPTTRGTSWLSGRAIALHSRILAHRHGGGGIADILAARNWDQFCAATDDMADFNLCFAYADRSQVGLRVSGHVPQGDPAILRFPLAGWQPADQGGVPSDALAGDDLPHIVNPPDGWIASANTALRPTADTQFGAEYLDPARAERIRELLTERAPHTPDGFAQMQSDRVSQPLRDFARLLPDDEFADWDGDMAPDSVDAAIVATTAIAFRQHALTELLGPDGYRVLQPMLAIPTLDIFAARATRWCNRRIAENPAVALPALRQARERAEQILRQRFGPDRSGWTWGRSRTLSLHHSLADAPVIGGLLSPGPFPYGGDADTIAQSGVLGSEEVASASAIPSLRLIVQLGERLEGRFALSGEQVHDPFHANGALTDAWLHGRTLPLLRDRDAIEKSAAALPTRRPQHLLLQPNATGASADA